MLASRLLVRRICNSPKEWPPITRRRQWQMPRKCDQRTRKFFSSTQQLNCSPSPIAPLNSLKENIKYLRKYVITSGKLPALPALDDVLDKIEKGEKVSSADALFLISPCESINNATHPDRMEYIKCAVQLLEANRSLRIVHYNRILEISIKEPNAFDMRQFIAKLQQNGVNTDYHTVNLLLKLLNIHLADGNAIKSDEIIRELIIGGPGSLHVQQFVVKIIGLHIASDNFPAAMDLYSIALANLSNFGLGESKTLALLQFLIDNDRLGEALKLAENVRKNDAQKGSFLKWNSIMRAFEKRCTEEELERLYVVLISKKVLIASTSILAPLIHQHLVAGNLIKAVQMFYSLAGTYRLTPCLDLLLTKLIESKEVEHLERVVTIALDFHGKQSLYNLARAFVNCNRVLEAKNIFEKLGSDKRSYKLQSIADHFYETGNDENLERLVAAIAEHANIDDRQYIQEKVLLARCRRCDSVDDILSVCNEMASEPSTECLQNVKRFFRAQNRSLPEKWSKDLQPASSHENDKSTLHKLIEVGDKMDEAKALVFQALQSDGDIRIDRRTLRYFLATCARNGDVETFNELRLKFDDQTKLNLKFSKFDCLAHIAADRCPEFLQLLSEKVATANTNTKKLKLSKDFPQEAYEMLKKYPSLCDKFQEVAIVYAKNRILKPMSLLWLYHLGCNNVDVCQRLHTEHKLLDAILCKLGTSIFLKQKDATQLKALAETLNKTDLRKESLVKLYESLLETLLHHQAHEQIAIELTNALEYVSLRDISQQTLDKIRFGGEKLVEANSILLSKSNK